MREVLEQLLAWWRAGAPAAMASVVATWDSSPRPPGAMMAVGPDGTTVGSVSGGCVEAAVYELALRLRDGEQPGPVLQRYGVSDEDALAVGLTCGGTIEVLVERVDRASFPQLAEVAAAIGAGEPVATVTRVGDAGAGARMVVGPDGDSGSLGAAGLDRVAADRARAMLAAGETGVCTVGDTRLFVATYPPRPRMIVFGAIDVAAAMARVGAFLGYRVTACDARATFATTARLPDADEVVVDWPHRYLAAEAAAGRVDERTVVCVLTHDPKFDVPVLEVALRLPLAYVGAMGSRRTHADRVARLRAAGVTDAELTRLAAPIGLDLGARTPEETAISVAAEVVARLRGGSGARLSELDGRIHR